MLTLRTLRRVGGVGEAALQTKDLAIDRILRGARGAEVSLEMPTRFPLTININAAKAITVVLVAKAIQHKPAASAPSAAGSGRKPKAG